jgi:serine/threonine protein kinase
MHIKISRISSFYIFAFAMALALQSTAETESSSFCTKIKETECGELVFENKNEPPAKFESMRGFSNIGEGSFGSVYKAIDESNNELVIKVVKKQIDENFEETGILQALQGIDGIPKFYSCEETDEMIFIYQESLFMDMEKRHSLQKLSKKDLKERLKLYRNLVNTVVRMHKEGILHRDIKPANIVAQTSDINMLMLIDFGVSHEISTNVTSIFGSPLFMSPELYKSATLWHSPTIKDENYALALSIFLIEFSLFPETLSAYDKCMKFNFDIDCHKKLIELISDSFKEIIEYSGDDSDNIVYEKLQSCLVSSLAYDESQRMTPSELLQALDLVIPLCQDRPKESQMLLMESNINEKPAESKSMRKSNANSEKSTNINSKASSIDLKKSNNPADKFKIEEDESNEQSSLNMSLDINTRMSVTTRHTSPDKRTTPSAVINNKIDKNRINPAKKSPPLKEALKISDNKLEILQFRSTGIPAKPKTTIFNLNLPLQPPTTKRLHEMPVSVNKNPKLPIRSDSYRVLETLKLDLVVQPLTPMKLEFKSLKYKPNYNKKPALPIQKPLILI